MPPTLSRLAPPAVSLLLFISLQVGCGETGEATVSNSSSSIRQQRPRSCCGGSLRHSAACRTLLPSKHSSTHSRQRAGKEPLEPHAAGRGPAGGVGVGGTTGTGHLLEILEEGRPTGVHAAPAACALAALRWRRAQQPPPCPPTRQVPLIVEVPAAGRGGAGRAGKSVAAQVCLQQPTASAHPARRAPRQPGATLQRAAPPHACTSRS